MFKEHFLKCRRGFIFIVAPSGTARLLVSQQVCRHGFLGTPRESGRISSGSAAQAGTGCSSGVWRLGWGNYGPYVFAHLGYNAHPHISVLRLTSFACPVPFSSHVFSVCR